MLREFACQNTDGTWEDGAFSLFPKQFDNSNLVMVERYHGKVIREYERNGRNDSDFFAVIWDEEKQKPRRVMYATTRAWSYACICIVDATDEIRAKAEKWYAARKKALDEYNLQLEEFIPRPGKTVRSLTTRGKAKGKSGTIEWIGTSSFTGKPVVIARLDNGDKVYIDLNRLELWSEKRGEWVKPAVKITKSLGLGEWFLPDSVLPYPREE